MPPTRRLVVTGDSARIQDETTENSAWFCKLSFQDTRFIQLSYAGWLRGVLLHHRCNKQLLLFSQCFLPYMTLIFYFKLTFKCRLQFVSIWTSLKFSLLAKGNSQLHNTVIYPSVVPHTL